MNDRMLACLQVKGFAIIDELDVEFKDGFNVITGETGAGKSIIINALSSLIMPGRRPMSSGERRRTPKSWVTAFRTERNIS